MGQEEGAWGRLVTEEEHWIRHDGQGPSGRMVSFNIYLLMRLPRLFLVACGSSLQHVGYFVAVHASLVAVCGLSCSARCGILVP